MPRYIDIEPIEKAAHDYGYLVVSIALINKQPTADVVERKKGNWKHEIVNNYTEKTYCSECGKSAPFVLVSDDYYGVHVHGEVKKTDFCPNCGAEME